MGTSSKGAPPVPTASPLTLFRSMAVLKLIKGKTVEKHVSTPPPSSLLPCPHQPHGAGRAHAFTRGHCAGREATEGGE